MKIFINASDVASIAGYNPYVTQEEIRNRIFKRNSFLNKDNVPIYSTNLEMALSKLTNEHIEEIKKELKLEIEENIKDKIVDFTQSQTTEKSEEKSKEMISKITKQYPCLSSVSSSIEQDVRMKRGELFEKEALDCFEIDSNIVIDNRNSKTYRKCICQNKSNEIWLCGKVDGIIRDKTIVESKNRRNKFFDEIPLYEKIQLEMYMFLLDKSECLQIQNYNCEQKIIRYSQDLKLFEECKQKFEKYFIDNLEF